MKCTCFFFVGLEWLGFTRGYSFMYGNILLFFKLQIQCTRITTCYSLRVGKADSKVNAHVDGPTLIQALPE